MSGSRALRTNIFFRPPASLIPTRHDRQLLPRWSPDTKHSRRRHHLRVYQESYTASLEPAAQTKGLFETRILAPGTAMQQLKVHKRLCCVPNSPVELRKTSARIAGQAHTAHRHNPKPSTQGPNLQNSRLRAEALRLRPFGARIQVVGFQEFSPSSRL